MEQQLMLGQLDVSLRGIDDALCACLEGGFELQTLSTRPARGAYEAYQGNHIGGVLDKFVRQLLVDRDEVCDVNIAVILLDEHILAYLIPWVIVSSCAETRAVYDRTCRRRHCRGESP